MVQLNNIDEINKGINQLQRDLINQLEAVSIEYIDLYAYADKINALKVKKNTLFLE